MIWVRPVYKLAGKMPLKAILPKRVQNRLYTEFIRELTRHWQEKRRADEIYGTASIRCDPGARLRLWIVTSRADMTMAFWCLKSLLHYSAEPWSITLADSGDLTSRQIQQLERHFPGICILSRKMLDEVSAAALKAFPFSHWLRHVRNYPPALKLFDPLLHMGSKPFLLIDSDVLCFERPAELISALTASNNSERGFIFNLEYNKSINSGLGAIVPEMYNIVEIENILAGMTKGQLRGWTTEQDAYTALAQGRYTGLPGDYAVQPVEATMHANLTTCHYIGVCRHRFYEQGIGRLRAQGFMGLSD